MTEGPRPIPSERPPGGNNEKDQQPVSAATIREPPPAHSSARPGSFAGTIIKQLFRAVKQTLTDKKDAAPEPKPTRRKGGEDTGRAAFKMAARKIVLRAFRLPSEAYAAATMYLSDTLEWLNLWEQNAGSDLDEDLQPAPQEHLYPHL